LFKKTNFKCKIKERNKKQLKSVEHLRNATDKEKYVYLHTVKLPNIRQVSNTSRVSTWYHLTRYDAKSVDQTLNSAEVGHGIYCFGKMKYKCILFCIWNNKCCV